MRSKPTSKNSEFHNGMPLSGQGISNEKTQGSLFSSRGSNGISRNARTDGARDSLYGAALNNDVMDEQSDGAEVSLQPRNFQTLKGNHAPPMSQNLMDQKDDAEDSQNMQNVVMEDSPTPARKPIFNDSVMMRFGASRGSDAGVDWAGSSIASSSPRGMKRSRGGANIADSPMRNSLKRIRKQSPLPEIVKGMANQLGKARLQEPGQMILQTEKILTQLTQDGPSDVPEEEASTLLSKASEQLTKVWASNKQSLDSAMGEDGMVSIGPSEDAVGYQKASFLATLLLPLHHPPPAKGRHAYALARREKLARSHSATGMPVKAVPVPRVLLDWLDRNLNPYPNVATNMLAYQPNATASQNYWDVIHTCILRGKIPQVIEILERSQFQYALTSRDDGFKHNGYQGQTLQMVEAVIDRCVLALKPYLNLQDEALDISRNDWLMFRRGIIKASQDLTQLAEGKDEDFDPQRSTTFEASNFGLKRASTLLSQTLRRAESRVPWTIYQNLKTLYGIMLGSTAEIVSSSQDWVEASIALTVWWDGNDEDGIDAATLTQGSIHPGKSRSTKAAQANRLVDINPCTAYQRRLAAAFERATEEKDDPFQIDTLNPVHVGLASVFEGNVDGLISLLRGWSLTIAAASVEVASLGGWFPIAGMMEDLDESDLLVLSSYGQPQQQLSKDNILLEYASALFQQGTIEDEDAEGQQERWMLSIQILARLEDGELASEKLRQLISHLPLESDQRIDRILEVCNDFGMEQEAHGIAEVCLNLTLNLVN